MAQPQCGDCAGSCVGLRWRCCLSWLRWLAGLAVASSAAFGWLHSAGGLTVFALLAASQGREPPSALRARVFGCIAPRTVLPGLRRVDNVWPIRSLMPLSKLPLVKAIGDALGMSGTLLGRRLSSPLPPRGIGLSKESARTIAAAVDDSKDLAKRAAAAARKRAKRAAKTLAEAPQMAFDSLKQQVRVSCSIRDRL